MHILCDEIRDFCQIFRHKRTALVAAVAAGAGGAVIVEAERERLIIRQLSALVDDGPHAPTDRLVKVCRDGKPGKIVVVEMLDDWPQECVADAKASVRRKIKIGKAPFQRGRQNSSCDADGLERVGKCVGRDNGTDGHILRKINHTIGKARERNVRTGSFQLHLIDEVCEQGAVFRQRQRIFRRNRHIEPANRCIEPAGSLCLGTLKCVCGSRKRDRSCRYQLGDGMDASTVGRYVHADKLCGFFRRLAGIRPADLKIFGLHMLVRCKQNIKPKLPADTAALVLAGL